jgi:tRNA-(ms[2]io[6]A)-hydroxylase
MEPTMDIQHILDFLACPTPQGWLSAAADPGNLATLLRDHAACELKAAQSAQSLIWKYTPVSSGGPASGERRAAPAVLKPPVYSELSQIMSRLAREELRHFEQVLDILAQRAIDYENVSPSRYAAGLRQFVRAEEPHKLADILIVGAFIEARSCERFAALAPLLDDSLAAFYQSLLKSEARHYQHYLQLAERFADGPIDGRVAFFREREAALIGDGDSQFRFHSGVPQA